MLYLECFHHCTSIQTALYVLMGTKTVTPLTETSIYHIKLDELRTADCWTVVWMTSVLYDKLRRKLGWSEFSKREKPGCIFLFNKQTTTSCAQSCCWKWIDIPNCHSQRTFTNQIRAQSVPNICELLVISHRVQLTNEFNFGLVLLSCIWICILSKHT